MYLTALILFANFCPCSRKIKNCVTQHVHNSPLVNRSPLLQGLNPCSANALNVSLSSLKSILVPTSIMGASGQWCFSSGYHLDVTFSNEEGLKSRARHALRKTIFFFFYLGILNLSTLCCMRARRNIPLQSLTYLLTLQHWNKWGKRLSADNWAVLIYRSLLGQPYLLSDYWIALVNIEWVIKI